jgi:hypothetical protein
VGGGDGRGIVKMVGVGVGAGGWLGAGERASDGLGAADVRAGLGAGAREVADAEPFACAVPVPVTTAVGALVGRRSAGRAGRAERAGEDVGADDAERADEDVGAGEGVMVAEPAEAGVDGDEAAAGVVAARAMATTPVASAAPAAEPALRASTSRTARSRRRREG